MKKTISTILILCSMATCFCIPVNALSETNNSIKTEKITVPSFINANDEIAKKHIKRLPEYENSKNTIGYLNDDGTKTAYVFKENVRYQDEKGKFHDRDNKIVETSGEISKMGFEYENNANDIKTYFDKEINKKGVKVKYKNSEITIKPLKEESNVNATVDNEKDFNRISYSNAFGKNTKLDLYTTFKGYKEDIVLNNYSGQNTFEFTANFGNLTPVVENKGVLLKDKDNNVVLEIPPIYVEDSSKESDKSGHFTIDNTISLTPLKNSGEYLLTITVDDNFLKDKNTVYPVKIDPSVATVQANNMKDAQVYSKYPTSNFGNSINNCVGTSPSTGIGSFYVQFDLSSLRVESYDNIISAYYHCREMSGISTNSVVESYIVSQPWSENTITWNNKPANMSKKIGSVNVSSMNGGNHNGGDLYWYDFYITRAVQGWKQGLPNYGLMFKERTDSSWKGFASKENSTYLPTLVVTYVSENVVTEGLGVSQQQYYIKNKNSKMYLTVNSDVNESNVYQSTFSGGNGQKWNFTYLNNGYYTIMPALSTTRCLDVYCGPTGPSGNQNEANVQIYNNGKGSNQQWKVIRNWDGSYRILSQLSNDVRGLTVKNAYTYSGANVMQFSYTTDFCQNADWTLEPVAKGDADFYDFKGDPNFGDFTTNVNAQANLAVKMGYIGYELTNPSASQAYGWMQNDSIWSLNCHGGPSSVTLSSPQGNGWTNSQIWATATEVSDCPKYNIDQLPANQLKKLELAFFNSCETGKDLGNSSMVGMTYKRGAHFVMAHTNYAASPAMYNWPLKFYQSLSEKKTIYDAIEDANNYIYQIDGGVYGNVNQLNCLGDYDMVLCH